MADKNECIWFDQQKYEVAEAQYQMIVADRHEGLKVEGKSILSVNPISTEIEKAMDLIGKSLKSASVAELPKLSDQVDVVNLEKRVDRLEEENIQLKSTLSEVFGRLQLLESHLVSKSDKVDEIEEIRESENDSEDDFELFGSDDGPELNCAGSPKVAYKKPTKPKMIAKSSLVLDIKPWDDETDVQEIERQVRSIAADGLLWGTSKILPVAYGIKKLQISCVIEDDKVGTDFLEESIVAFEDLVQSMDVVAFNKI